MAAPQAAISGSGTVEREMNVHQRSLVDTCFEEEQYEAGIAVLDQLRSPKHMPFPAHIRQLIYIALYPPPAPPAPSALEGRPELEIFELGSPSKGFARQQGSSRAPPPAATEGALRLLTAFVHTNSPEALFRALPSYPAPGAAANTGVDDEDSFIAKQAVRIKRARSFWEVLKEGFVQRARDTVAVPTGKGKGRARAAHGDDGDMEGPSAVGPYTWPILDWFVTLLERDEKKTARRGQPAHSPFLLSQIPPSRINGGPRWEVDAPLEIVFCALQQPDAKRRSVGVRLFALLITLASTTLVDFPLFLNAVSSRASALPLDALQALFAILPRTRTITHFRIALCRTYLAAPSASAARPRPVPARRGRPADHAVAAGAASAPPGAGTPSLARRHASIAPAEVLELIRTARRAQPGARLQVLVMKRELVAAYALLDREAGVEPASAEWRAMLRGGQVREAFEAAMAERGRGAKGDEDALRTMREFVAMMSAC